jgi:hypothetical protein
MRSAGKPSAGMYTSETLHYPTFIISSKPTTTQANQTLRLTTAAHARDPNPGPRSPMHAAQAESLSPTERASPAMLNLGACVLITRLHGRLLSFPTPSPTAAGILCAVI